MRAAWFDPLRRGQQDLDGAGLVATTPAGGVDAADFFAGQRTFDEHGFAIPSRHTLPLMGQVIDANHERFHRNLGFLGHGARNELEFPRLGSGQGT